MKFIDVGKKNGGPVAATESPKNEKYYPQVYLDVAPDSLWEKEVGDECQIECVVVIKSKSSSEQDSGRNKTISLEIKKIAYDNDEDDKGGKELKRQFQAMKGIEAEDDDEGEGEDGEN